MKILVFNNIKNKKVEFERTLRETGLCDFIIITGEISQESQEIINRSLAPIMVVTGDCPVENIYWPVVEPYGVIYDNSMQLIVHNRFMNRGESINSLHKFRNNICLSPENNNKKRVFERIHELNSAIINIPDFDNDKYIFIENSFSSVLISLKDLNKREKTEVLSFFW